MGFTDRLIATLLPDVPALDPDERAAVARDVAAVVRRFLAAAPFHVRAVTATIGAVLWIWLGLGGLTGGKPANLLAAFESLPGPGQVVMRLYRSLALLAFYEHPLVEAGLGIEAPGERQARFRALRETALAGGEARP